MMSHNSKLAAVLLGVIVILLLLFLWGAELLHPFFGKEPVVAAPSLYTAEVLDIGGKAPYFSLPDLSGRETGLADLSKTPLVITFWSTRASDARDQIKLIDDFKTSHPQALFEVVTINILEDEQTVGAFIGRGAYDVPVLLDEQGGVGKIYDIRTLPTSFFIDQSGVIRAIHVGLMSQAMIEQTAESIIGRTGI